MIPNVSDEIGKTVREHHALAALRILNGEDLRGAANDNLLLSLFTLLGFKISHIAMRALIDHLERIGTVGVTRRDTLPHGALPVHGRALAN
jgi:hypothetical protein